MGYIIIAMEDVPIPGHHPEEEVLFQALEDYIRFKSFVSGYQLDGSRGLDWQSSGKVPVSVGAWTTSSIRVVAKRIDWVFTEIGGEPTTVLTVQFEQH